MNKIAMVAACLLAAGTLSAVESSNHAPTTEMFSKESLKTFKGSVKEVQRVEHEGMVGVHVVLDVEGKAVVVLLGPAPYLEEVKFDPKVGDAVEVTGFTIETGKEQEVIAKSVKFGDKEFKFRDDGGVPEWSGSKMRRW
ncbi:hypothetical protein [Estrella lausannensis]|uniref:Putative secreted protein n=1 Tax=Estrella lausannensis TaxID=483423 RepID=A0A0H5DQC9_9BACT|nr:hypothetical protein [Estrella lausannensis]CRX38273.1 putative secreted protein [Estrella lausannensis]